MPQLSSGPSRALWLASLVCGVVAPVLFLRLEFKTHCLSGCLFDPIPTPWHFVALVLVPLANCLILASPFHSILWLRRAALFLRWSALIIPLFYAIAMGWAPLAAILFAPLSLGRWAIMGFPWPDGGYEGLNTETAISVILVLCPHLALLGWTCLLPWSLWLRRSIVTPVRSRLAWGGALFALTWVIGMELPMVRTFDALRAYAEGKTRGEVPDLLRQDSKVALLARLFVIKRPSSSDGIMDCEGPVDVFGPTVHMMSGWDTATGNWYRLRWNHVVWAHLLRRIQKEDPSTNIAPRSWRRLSPWEKKEIREAASASP